MAGNPYKRKSIKVDGKWKQVYVHHLVWVEHRGSIPDGMYIDHRDGNKHNNEISNLRLCSNAQNNWNLPKQKNNKSGVKGVHWSKSANKWCAQFRAGNGVRINVGYFESLDDAAKAISAERVKYHKEYSHDG